MKQITFKQYALISSIGLVVAWSVAGHAQVFPVTNWVNNPFCINPNFILNNSNSAAPNFLNNTAQRGTLYANAQIGERLILSVPGDRITLSGSVTLSGDLNPDGNLQFRFALLYRGTNVADTNWLGYFVGNPIGSNGAETSAFFVRNNPNPGIYTSGSVGNAMRPQHQFDSFIPGWGAGSYDFALSVALASPRAHVITWKLNGVGATPYRFAGVYTNTFELTMPPAFDQVGFLSGAGLFAHSSPSNNILSFTNLIVTFGN